jgi:putative intracellular protease/amidase
VTAPIGAQVRPIRKLGRALRKKGVELEVASECHGEVRDEHGKALYANLLLVEAAGREWDGVVVGGGRGALRVVEDPLARETIARVASRGGPVAALGEGLAVVARAGVPGFASNDVGEVARWLSCEMGE